MVVTQLPDDIRRLTDAFVEELDATLGPRFVGLFQYGAVCFPPSPVSDFDAHVIVDRPFDDDDRTAVSQMLGRLKALPRGDDMDVWYVTLDSMRSNEAPQTELRPGYRDDMWAVHRAHIHAGRFVHVRGPDPRDLVPVPTWAELDEALAGELEDIEDGLDQAQGHAYAVLNLCRLLYSYETRDVVIGKLQAAVWALAAVDVTLHGTIRAAIDAYRSRTFAPLAGVVPFCEAVVPRIHGARVRADRNE